MVSVLVASIVPVTQPRTEIVVGMVEAGLVGWPVAVLTGLVV